MTGKRIFKKITVDKQTFEAIERIAQATGLKKTQLFRFVFNNLDEVLPRDKKVGLTMIKNLFNWYITVGFTQNETYMLPLSKVIESHE